MILGRVFEGVGRDKDLEACGDRALGAEAFYGVHDVAGEGFFHVG